LELLNAAVEFKEGAENLMKLCNDQAVKKDKEIEEMNA